MQSVTFEERFELVGVGGFDPARRASYPLLASLLLGPTSISKVVSA